MTILRTIIRGFYTMICLFVAILLVVAALGFLLGGFFLGPMLIANFTENIWLQLAGALPWLLTFAWLCGTAWRQDND